MPQEIALAGTIIVPFPRAGFNAVGARFELRGPALEGQTSPACPAQLDVAWAGWSQAIAEAMVLDSDEGPPPFIGELDDGRFVVIEASQVRDVRDSPKLARFNTSRCTIHHYRPPGYGCGAWLYELLNFQMRSGDLLAEESTDRGWSFSRDTIEFSYDGRSWMLRDTLRHQDDREHRDFRKHTQPVWAGWLWTEMQDGDNPDVIDQQAYQLCNLISFATERSVRWRTRTHVDDAGIPRGSFSPSTWCAPASAGGDGPIDTHGSGTLAAFLTRGGEEVSRDPDWWNRTLELHLQAVLSPIIDVRLTFFYVLLDRITRRVVGSSFPFQIADDLNARLDEPEWKARLAGVFGQLCDEWPQSRTDGVIETIKKWNAEPSFPRKVDLAATALSLPEPSNKLIRERHLLIHDCRVPAMMPSGIRHLGDFGRAVEALVTAMLLRMLGHAGPAYLPDASRSHLPIHPWPVDRPTPWGLKTPE